MRARRLRRKLRSPPDPLEAFFLSEPGHDVMDRRPACQAYERGSQGRTYLLEFQAVLFDIVMKERIQGFRRKHGHGAYEPVEPRKLLPSVIVQRFLGLVFDDDLIGALKINRERLSEHGYVR